MNKSYLSLYVAVFLWAYNIKAVTDKYVQTLMGVKVDTDGHGRT